MKLTKKETKLHETALAVLDTPDVHKAYIDCPLCDGRGCDDCSDGKVAAACFVFEHYHPGAVNNIGKGGIFFTPTIMAKDAAMYGACGGTVIDLCAGIGVLAYFMRRFAPESKLTCVEINPEFCKAGKRLVPEAEWINADAWDIADRLGHFDAGISNPPFGNIYSNGCSDFRSAAHMAACALLIKKCRQGAIVIIPSGDHSKEDQQHDGIYHSQNYKRFKGLFPEARITPGPFDFSNVRFKGAMPKVSICDLSVDGTNPYLQ